MSWSIRRNIIPNLFGIHKRLINKNETTVIQKCINKCVVHSYRQKYTLALTRGVPDSFVNALSSNSTNHKNNPISISKAREQHDIYEGNIRTIVYALSIPSNESYPDCPFIEDTVVAIGKRALVNRIGAVSRQGEADEIKMLLEKLGMSVTDMRNDENGATCDGGDVLYPGGGGGGREGKQKQLFVGISNRTNEEGIAMLKKTFSDLVDVIPVPISGLPSTLHLKSIVTHLDENTLVAPKGHIGDEVIRAMEAEDKYGYNILRLPDERVCNLVSVNGVILAAETECEETKSILNQAIKLRNMEIRYLNMDEFAKCDGALTCCSVLLDLD